MNKIKYRINKIRNYDYKRLLKEIALYLVLIIIVIIIVLIISGNIKFYIIQSDDFLETYSWMLLTMIGYGGFFTACQFFILGLTLRSIKYSIIILLLILFIIGIGTISIQFELYFWFLLYPYFSFGNYHGLMFLSVNNYIFLVFYAISLSIMREKRD